MTPLQFAQSLAADLATLPLPPEHHGQLGDIVVPCAGTYVSVMNTTEVDPSAGGTGHCDKIQMGEISVVVARECANVANQDGTTNWAQQDIVSASMDADGQTLRDWADKMQMLGWYTQGTPVVTYSISGALQMVILGFQLPIP